MSVKAFIDDWIAEHVRPTDPIDEMPAVDVTEASRLALLCWEEAVRVISPARIDAAVSNLADYIGRNATRE